MSKTNVLRKAASNTVKGLFGGAHFVLDSASATVSYTEGYLIEKLDGTDRAKTMMDRMQSTLDSQDEVHKKYEYAKEKVVSFRESLHQRFEVKRQARA